MKSEIFREKLEKAPDNLLFRFSYGQALFAEGHSKDAIAVLEPAIDKKPDWMIALLILGKAHLELENYSAAKNALEKAMKAAFDQNHEEPREEIQSLLEQCK
jgi:tetratricopeptide (TPR) repeat protein|tara:strand:- start:829 stop:1134 length:306 start_codon:yes stop_codon:yes gene_type:complete